MKNHTNVANYPDVAILQPPLALGYVSLLGTILLIPTSTLVAPIGAHLAHKMSKRRLEIMFGLFLAFVCIRFAASLFA